MNKSDAENEMSRAARTRSLSESNPPPAADPNPDYNEERQNLIRLQLEAPGRDIHDARILRAMENTPRHLFVPEQPGSVAYADRPLPIGYGQTISQPYIVAYMTTALDPKPTDRVLDVGTGSGYQAAVLSALVREVYSIEIVEPLAQRAMELLSRLSCANVTIQSGDGYQGWPQYAPFDAILVACAADHVPPPLTAQLKEGGRLMIPIGGPQDQVLYLFEKKEGHVLPRAMLPVRFVPMTGEAFLAGKERGGQIEEA